MIFAQKLTNLQLELIKLFAYQIPDSQIIEIKDLLAKYFAEAASKEMDKLWEENQWNNETMENWLEEHNRISHACANI
jgi:DNA-binding FadR family transcriptional regulator